MSVGSEEIIKNNDTLLITLKQLSELIDESLGEYKEKVKILSIEYSPTFCTFKLILLKEEDKINFYFDPRKDASDVNWSFYLARPKKSLVIRCPKIWMILDELDEKKLIKKIYYVKKVEELYNLGEDFDLHELLESMEIKDV